MAANTSPIFSKAGLLGFANLTGNIANTKSDGTGTLATDIFLVFTADATNGSYVEKVRIMAVGTTASTATTQSILRIFLSTKASGATTGGTDTWLLAEVPLASTTADSNTAAAAYFEVPVGFIVPAGYTILASIHANVASATSWQVSAIAGQY